MSNCVICARSIATKSDGLIPAPASKRERKIKVKQEQDFEYSSGGGGGNSLSTALAADLLERETWTIFLLRKILLVPERVCEDLIKTKGNPTEWDLKCCDNCSETLIAKTENVFHQLSKLNSKLFKLKSSIRKTVLHSGKRASKNAYTQDSEWTHVRSTMIPRKK